MTIRPATVGDLDAIVAMGEAFLASDDYAGRLAIVPAAMRAFVERVVTGALDHAVVFVADTDGAVVGMLGAAIAAHPYSGEVIGSELFWWMQPEARGGGVRLMQMAERWAAERGARRFQMIAPNDRVARFYVRCGYHPVEAMYERSL